MDLAFGLEFDTAFAAWLERPRAVHTGPRLILAGSVPPDERLHGAVEGATIRSLSDHYHALPCGSRGFEDRSDRLLERAAACRAHGVILWLIEEDEALVWDVPVMQQRLSAAGIPILTLARRRWDLRDDALDLIREFTARLRQAL
jgi:hypothetical protein